MKTWQHQHILQNLPKLIETTDCNLLLLATLQSQNILSDEELQVIHNKGTNVEKCCHVFNILPKREKSYEALISALHNTCQSGAVKILATGFISHGTINFQSKYFKISELLPNLDKNLKMELIHLQQAQPCVRDVIIKNTIPRRLDYYVPRTIVCRRKLDKSLFQEKCSDVFLFQGLEWSELSNLADEMQTDVSSDLLHYSDQLHARHILLESLDHFDIIVDKTSEPVHLIQHSNGAFEWIKSKASVQTIQKFANKTMDVIKEEELIENILLENTSVCLTDSPGLGKTILLANLAIKVVARHPMRLVIFIRLREFIPVLESKLIAEAHMDGQLIHTLLSEYVTDNAVGRRIVLHKLVNEHCYLCFDGLDEVLLEQQELAKKMLKVITDSFRNCQMLVTARLHMRQELEQIIGTLGFHIAPFNINDQIQFLTKFWESRGAKSENLMEYAKTCLTSVTAQINDNEQGIAGIPLQSYMIGEVFLAKAKCYNSGLFLGAEVPIRSIAHLYSELINMKLDALVNENIKESLIQAHVHSSMALLFPEEVLNFIEFPANVSNEQLWRVGIMEHDVETGAAIKLRFVHQTFAEFFVGLFAATLIQKLDYQSVQFVIKKILATYQKNEYLIDNPLGRDYLGLVHTSVYQHPVIAYFLIFQLQQQKIQICSLNVKLSEHEALRSILAAISFDSLELFNYYVKLNNNYNSDLFSGFWPLIQLVAAKHSSLAILERTFELSKEISLDKHGKGNKSDLLNQASYSGNYKIVEYLIRSKHISLDDTPHVLHFCLWYSNLQSDAIIKRKIQIIKYLSQRSSSILVSNRVELSPILGKCIHLELFKCALQNGAKVQNTDFDDKSVLHLAPEYMTPADYLEFTIFVVDLFGKDVLSKTDDFECTPLHYAVQHLPILSQNLELFLNHGANINAKDKKGNSVLFYAVGYQTKETLELLKKHGAKLDDKNLELETALHIAYKFTNTSAITWLTEQGADDQVADAKGVTPSKAQLTSKEFRNTCAQTNLSALTDGKYNKETNADTKTSFSDPLVIAVNNPNPEIISTVSERNEIKSNQNKKRNTSLHIEFCQPSVDIEKMKMLFHSKADFNARNFDGDAPLHLGVCNAKLSKEVIDFAVKHGKADLNLVNDCGFSVFTQAVYAKRKVSFLKTLVEYGADACKLNNLEAAIRNCDLECVQFLLEQGADVIKISREGQEGNNPIALAFQLHEEAHFEILKCLITSTSTLTFDEPTCIMKIIDCAVDAYKKSKKFQTVELFNLMASRGLDYAHCDAVNHPVLFIVLKCLTPVDQASFVLFLNSIGLNNLFKIQNIIGDNLLIDCIKKFEIDKEFISMFSANGVDFNIKNTHGENVLTLAIKNNYSDQTLETLTLFGADPHVLDEHGNNLMFLSIQIGSCEGVTFLLNNGVDLHLKNKSGLTPFIYACCWYIQSVINLDLLEFVTRFAELVKLNWCQVQDVYCGLRGMYKTKYDKRCGEVFKMFKTLGLNITAADMDRTPVFFSILRNLDLGQVESYIKHVAHAGYANLGELKNSQLINVAQYFIQNTKYDFPIKLLPLLGDVKEILNSSDSNGWPMLAYTIENRRSVEYMKDLIKNGADVNHLNEKGLSLLHYAARNGDLNCLEFFVDQVKCKNCVDYDEYSALHWAFLKKTQNYDNAKLLISKGVSVNLETFEGLKIIDVAVNAYERWGNFKSKNIFTLMLAHGLDVESKNTGGCPVLFKMIPALRSEHCEDILKYLYHNKQNHCFHIHGNDGETLLQRCRRSFEPSTELLNIFKSVGAD